MKKVLLFLALIISVEAFSASSENNIVSDFMSTHTPFSYKIYCRDEVKVAECRSLTLFRSNETGRVVNAFQISFFAPSRPFAATELFVPLEGEVISDGSGLYQNFVDNTMNGDFSVSATHIHSVEKGPGSVTITDLPFGALSFFDDKAVVTLNNGSQIFYSELD